MALAGKIEIFTFARTGPLEQGLKKRLFRVLSGWTKCTHVYTASRRLPENPKLPLVHGSRRPRTSVFTREPAFSAASRFRFARCEPSFVLKTPFFSRYCGNVPDASTARTEPTGLGRAPRWPTEMSEYPVRYTQSLLARLDPVGIKSRIPCRPVVDRAKHLSQD